MLSTKYETETLWKEKMDMALEQIIKISGIPEDRTLKVLKELGVPCLKQTKFSHNHFQESQSKDIYDI
jgi:hypothetical protein